MATRASLQGITWNHSRGFSPLSATGQRFEETHSGVEISWHKRSLSEFADLSITQLARQFDFLVIDYPFAGNASAEGYLLPLDEHLPPDFLADQATNSVGASHGSYAYGGHQWALATDAAAPVASWRADLLDRLGLSIPRTWDELLDLARRGLVAVPGIPVDALVHFYMLCEALGEEPFSSPDRMVSKDIGAAALERLRELFALCSPACLARNPIDTYEAMVSGDEIAYCPFAFAYSNYARPGFARTLLRYGPPVTLNGRPLRTSLGGAGIAISSFTRHRQLALDYALFVNGPACQRTLYFTSGGQPGHRSAWTDSAVNGACSNFFADILETMDRSMLRPAYDGHVQFQDEAGKLVNRFLAEGTPSDWTLGEMEKLYVRERR